MSAECLSDRSESDVIQYIAHRFASRVDGEIGIGDDGAVIHHASPLVAVADAMVEDVHFSRAFSPAHAVGEKLVAVNASDIAAMGARPTRGLFTLSVPKSLQWSWARDLIDGVAVGANKYGLSVIGGDVTASPGPIALSFTLLGALHSDRPLRRDVARAGEQIYVTGTLGGAALGLVALQTGNPDPTSVPESIQALHVPIARIDEGAALAEWHGCHCAMDISDGLLTDCARLAQASNVDLLIEIDKLPMSRELVAVGSEFERCAITGGEDYELLFTAFEQPPFPATAIGMVTQGSGKVRYSRDGVEVPAGSPGYSHF